jgi:hypothetical protein
MINKSSNATANTPAMSTKQGITPSSAPLTVTKQGVAPSSAPGGSLTQKSGVIPGSTPARPPGLGDASKLIPTLLDYANEQNVSPSKSTTDKSATGTGSSTGSATSPGLSLLASSAASQKYIGDRSWDHVVSDILRASLSSPPKSTTSASNIPMAKQQDNKNDAFMAQYQKYTSSVFNQQLGKEVSKTSPPKSQQQSPSSSLQINPQDAHHMVQKLKAAQIQKHSPPQAHQKSATNVQLTSYLNAQKSVPGNSMSVLNQDAYKQFLESQGKLQQSFQSGGDIKQKNVPTQRSKPKTIVVYSNSGSANSLHVKPTVTKYTSPNVSNTHMDSVKKPILVRSISQGSVSSQTGTHIQAQRISPTSAHISGQRVSPMASPGAGPRHSPSKLSGNFHNPHSVSTLTSPSKGEAAATNLLQSLFGQIDQASHSQLQKSPSPSGAINRSTPPQNKTSASPIWSMTSIVQTQQSGTSAPNSNTPPSPYSMPGMPKPVPGYQSIKLSNFKESGVNVGMQSPHSPTMKSLLQHPLSQGEYNSMWRLVCVRLGTYQKYS